MVRLPARTTQIGMQIEAMFRAVIHALQGVSLRRRYGLGTILLPVLLLWVNPMAAQAQVDGPRLGWKTDLSELQHDVSGWVEIVDDRTLRLHDFTYDGLAPRVYVTLAAEDTNDAFRQGIYLEPVFAVGRAYDNEMVEVTLPSDVASWAGFHAVSIWCDEFSVNFGSGVFLPPTKLYIPSLLTPIMNTTTNVDTTTNR
jgi:hypothetical protein